MRLRKYAKEETTKNIVEYQIRVATEREIVIKNPQKLKDKPTQHEQAALAQQLAMNIVLFLPSLSPLYFFLW
jgi:uncharacterized membrane protein